MNSIAASASQAPFLEKCFVSSVLLAMLFILLVMLFITGARWLLVLPWPISMFLYSCLDVTYPQTTWYMEMHEIRADVV